MTPRRLLAVVLVTVVLTHASARAHFLFVRILPPAEAGRAAEVYFSEQAEAGDPTFIDKIAHTQLWMQTTPGKFETLKVHKAADRLRAFLPASGSIVVVGKCEYGVLARPKQTPFLLHHYPKAIAGSPEELNRMQPWMEAPLEITAELEGDGIQFVALWNGMPMPGAELQTIDAKLHNEKLKADADGRTTWKPPGPGRYSVYTSHVTKKAGVAGGKKYEEIREFATLAFTWPVERREADPMAVALFQEAVAARAQWQDFPGVSARIAGMVDGRPFEGKVTIAADGSVELDSEEMVVIPWVREQLESTVLHRMPSSSKERPKPVLWFADNDEDHPLGRLLIFEGGKFASSYRVKDRQLLVVNRHLGKQNMTITVLDNERNGDGLFLPHSYTVQYWDAASGDLRRTETVQERWQRVGSWDLPARHTVTGASDSGLSVRSFMLSKHALLRSK